MISKIISKILLFILIPSFLYSQRKKDSIVYKEDYTKEVYFEIKSKNKYIKSPLKEFLKPEEKSFPYFQRRIGEKTFYFERDSSYVHCKNCWIFDIEKPGYDTIQHSKDYYKYMEQKTFFNDNSDNLIYIGLQPIFSPLKQFYTAKGSIYKGLKQGQWEVNNLYFAKIIENYDTGIRNGDYIVYDEQGKILYKTIFKKGSGVEKVFRRNGSIYQIRCYKDNFIDKNSKEIIYYENGNVFQEKNYKNNIIIQYSITGKIIHCNEISN